MLTVIETDEFIATAGAFWNEEQRAAFVEFIAANPKVRWAAKGHGKRGGARVIYFVRRARGDVVLMTAYSKGRVENLPAHLLRKLMEKHNV